MNKYLITLAASLLISSMQVSAKPAIAKGELHVGDYYQGGVIFKLDYTDQGYHGLIADIKDATSNPNDSEHNTFMWDTNNNSTTGATSMEIYAGQINTKKIITAIGYNRAQAASACVTSSNQGYGDWYLPSFLEVDLMFLEKDAINKTSSMHGGDASLSENGYWSSTESNTTNALCVFSSNSSCGNPKNSYNNVRCIRTF